jgi:hypothetical protein
MSFGSINIGSTTFIEAGQGRYIDDSVPFGGPKNELKISPGSYNKKATPPVTVFSVSRLQEFPVTEAGVTTNRRCQVVTTYTLEKGITITDADALGDQISTFTVPAVLTQIANGAS